MTTKSLAEMTNEELLANYVWKSVQTYAIIIEEKTAMKEEILRRMGDEVVE